MPFYGMRSKVKTVVKKTYTTFVETVEREEEFEN
jgi:hypothetical protein